MLNIKDIIESTGGEVASEGSANFLGISIDSRTIKDGELFIALKGDKFDGHDFVDIALERGNGAVVNAKFKIHDLKFKNKTIIFVDNTLLALHNLARRVRNRFTGHVVGIVGSNGKTTTKELISSILATRWSILKTAGNLNNHIGMPLSIINGDRDCPLRAGEIMVLEMGANKPGDIDELCSIALPDLAVVTNIGYEHMDGFGSLLNVRDSELEILPYIKKVSVNADDLFLMEGVKRKIQITKRRAQIITFGITSQEADLVAKDIIFSEEGAKFILCTNNECTDINSKLPGRFNVYNSLAAASVAYAIGFSLREIKSGLESFEGIDMRFEIKKYKGITFLNDAYNANPSSMDESINEMARLLQYSKKKGHKYKRTIVVLGDMLQLGSYGFIAHKKLGQKLSALPVDIFIGVGQLMSLAVDEFKGRGIYANTSENAGLEIEKILKEGDIVLIKGSREMKMEKVLTAVKKR